MPPKILLAAQPAMALLAQQLPAGWLTDSEQARLNAMQQPARRQEFVACRCALRHLLAWDGEKAAETWWLDGCEGIAPRLSAMHHGTHAAESTHLSLSHSSAYLVCACGSQPIGVDMEVKDVLSGTRDVMALASVACSGWETQQLRAIDCEIARYRLFLQWWSLKEAYFKCIGEGVDFSRIRHIECRSFASGNEPTLAHARSWTGTTALGHDVVLSVCALENGLSYCDLRVSADIEWVAEDNWRLLACAS